MGGTIGLAVGKVVLNGYVSRKLRDILTDEQAAAVGRNLSALDSLNLQEQLLVRRVFGEGYKRQTQVLLIFSTAVLLSCVLIWEKKPRRHVIDSAVDDNLTPA